MRDDKDLPNHLNKLNPPSVEILVIEDHPLYRDGLKFCLIGTAEPTTFTLVVTEAIDIHTAVQKIIERPHIRVAVVDIILPGLNGIDGIKQLLQVQPKLNCVILSSNLTSQTIEKAKRAGAVAAIDKSTPCADIRSMIYKIANISATQTAPGEFFKTIGQQNGKLTDRQLEITKLLAHGLRNKVIGDQLGISENTVRIHVSNIFRALGCTSRTEVAHVARSLGILE